MLYLLHFDRRIGREGRNGAQHYLGYCTSEQNLEERLARHQDGRGAKITAYVATKGIAMRLVRVWNDGTRSDEHRRKQRGHYDELCPECCASRHISMRGATHQTEVGYG